MRLHDIIVRQHQIINVIAENRSHAVLEVSIDVFAEQAFVPLDHDRVVLGFGHNRL